jgi:hypothetical protein
MSAAKVPDDFPRFCVPCAFADHRACTGLAPARGGSCECADRSHDPEVRVAAAMRVFVRFDRVGAPPETLATEWRKDPVR